MRQGRRRLMPAVLNAANEVANAMFQAEQIGFLDIEKIVATVMERHSVIGYPDLDEVLAVDAWAREMAKQVAVSIANKTLA